MEKSTRGGIEKGIIQLTLGNLYWEMGRYADAQTAYADAIGLLEKTHDQFKEVNRRSEILDELVPYANAVELQDSLQFLASLDSMDRMVVIDTLIVRVIQKEKEEAAAQKALERQQQRDELIAENSLNNTQQNTTTPTIQIGNNAWYFYNPQTVAQGKNEFQRVWGKRKSEDNWRRKNKTVVSLEEFETVNYDEEEEDDTAKALTENTSNEQSNDDLAMDEAEVIDEKNPLFYLRQIPLTPEAMAESNGILTDGLFNMAMIYKDKLEDFPRADKAFSRLLNNFADFALLDEAYYNYFLLLGRMERIADANLTKQQLIELFPESKYAITLADPDFAYNAVHGKRLEDSLYAATYRQYTEGNFRQVIANAEVSAAKYPMGKHRPKFLFLQAVTNLQTGNQKLFLDELKVLVQEYPENEITDIAAHILKGVQEGRLLAEGSTSFGNIWGRRNSELPGLENREEGVAVVDTFTVERNIPFLFVLAYEEGAINENLLLYEVARYNFSSFMVKNFDLAFAHDYGIGRLIVKEFANMDEALYYQRQIYADPAMNEKLSGLRSIIISEANYDLLNKYYSFDDYDTFYNETFMEPDARPKEEEELFDNISFDDPILNLPPVNDENSEGEDDGEEIEEGAGNYYIYENKNTGYEKRPIAKIGRASCRERVSSPW